MPPSRGLIVRPILTKREFLSCLKLRFEEYTKLNYIHCQNDFELDSFDRTSFHFGVFDEQGEIAATVRLIIPYDDPTWVEDTELSRWCAELGGIPVFPPVTHSRLPVSETIKCNSLDPSEILGESTSELSRIIVSRDFRGIGLARQLVEAVVARAVEAKRKRVILECLSSHIALFSRFNFSLVRNGLDFPLLSVAAPVAIMKLEL